MHEALDAPDALGGWIGVVDFPRGELFGQGADVRPVASASVGCCGAGSDAEAFEGVASEGLRDQDEAIAVEAVEEV